MDSPSPHGPSARNSPNPDQTSLPHRPAKRTQSSDSSASTAQHTPIPDDKHGADLPMNLSASVVLTGLPRDAHQALADAEAVDKGKVTVRFQPLPSAPILKTRVFKVSASQKFETVVNFLRKRLDCKETDSVFCYVNSVFAPGLDEGIGGLWRCFKTDEQLIVAYSMTPAFG
ncbi:ubiquitin-like protein ATG12 [Aspergillus brunneoviolaceus CBS 621.78]|uniref:Autophagy-related protein 12 n=1 Tax=Aspergillus brunneoviolaceus CBS 621.78 TaxID=1450534 RepID=A0ACD1FV43_9EURO|nr:autophagy-related protein 12 [Aspergillus brunneoviolaceus CBS 621.78]RAH40839.1 autophagy-related protein 12 [Aspergillus brunneoviolaceus CBS 621.78]